MQVEPQRDKNNELTSSSGINQPTDNPEAIESTPSNQYTNKQDEIDESKRDSRREVYTIVQNIMTSLSTKTTRISKSKNTPDSIIP